MNVNQVYMAGLMTAPMVVIELLVMRGMYHSRKLNLGLVTSSLVAGLLFFFGIQKQVAVGDRQFLRSMIPHHSAAILMCRQAPTTDAKIQQLCHSIVQSQRQEIDQMRAWLSEGR